MSRLTDTLSARLADKGMTQAELARRIGVIQQTINGFFNGKVAKTSYWREISKELDIPEDEMREMMVEAGREAGKNTKLPRVDLMTHIDRTRRLAEAEADLDRPLPNARMLENQMPMQKPGRMLPVLGEAVGGVDGEYLFNGSVLDYVACPPSLTNVPNAYAIYVDGESMMPRYRPGEVCYVHPGKPARRGDDVIVQIQADQEGMAPRGFIKEFVGWNGDELVLRQYNPESKIKFERFLVVSVHPIVLSGKY